jgi:hypothetical protein
VKKCNKCGSSYPATEEFFRKRVGKSGKESVWSPCRKCERKYTKEWYASRTEEQKAKVLKRGRTRSKIWQRENQLHIRTKWLQKQYGLTLSEFGAMVVDQNGGCAICGTEIDLNDKHSCNVDHRHADGFVRGILCSKCNQGIGLFNDDPMLLLSAAQYVSD